MGGFSFVFCSFLSLSAMIFTHTLEFNRKVETICVCPHHPSCPNPVNGTIINIYHTIATGSRDVLHYITSTHGYPGLLVARTPRNSSVDFNVAKFLSANIEHSITFSPPAEYAYSLHFLQLLEYNDVNDTANITTYDGDSSLYRHYDLAENITWSDSTIDTNIEKNQIVFTIQNSTADDKFVFQGNGSIKITIDITNMTGRGSDLPHLQYTSNASLIDITIDNLRPTFNQSRFAMEMVLVTSDDSTHGMSNISEYSSIDDEYTPGVFQIVDLTMRQPKQTSGAYVQWKPVCYNDKDRKVNTATKAKHYDLGACTKRLVEHDSLAFAYFGEKLLSNKEVTQAWFNVSFGLTKDKFYVHTNYTSWELTIGYGGAPVEEISSLVLAIISVGFGIPVIVILFGGIGVCVKRKKSASEMSRPDSNEYAVIN